MIIYYETKKFLAFVDIEQYFLVVPRSVHRNSFVVRS